MKKTAWLFNFVFILALLTASTTRAAMAGAHISLSPSSGNYSVNNTFTVTMNADSASEVVGGVDAVGTYDSSKLELVSATKASGMVFESTDGGGSCSINTGTAGKFSITCYSNDALTDKAINGPLVVLNFRAKSTGTATVSFTCTSGSTTDSNIVKTSTSGDVISCSENVGGSYTIGESDGDNEDESTTTPASLPQSGSTGVTLALVVFGAVTVLSAVFLRFL